MGFPATQRCVAEHPVLIFLQVRAGRVKLIEFLRSGSRSTCGLWHTLGGTRERESGERAAAAHAAGRVMRTRSSRCVSLLILPWFMAAYARRSYFPWQLHKRKLKFSLAPAEVHSLDPRRPPATWSILALVRSPSFMYWHSICLFVSETAV